MTPAGVKEEEMDIVSDFMAQKVADSGAVLAALDLSQKTIWFCSMYQGKTAASLLILTIWKFSNLKLHWEFCQVCKFICLTFWCHEVVVQSGARRIKSTMWIQMFNCSNLKFWKHFLNLILQQRVRHDFKLIKYETENCGFKFVLCQNEKQIQ